jgi:hypothetical protein
MDEQVQWKAIEPVGDWVGSEIRAQIDSWCEIMADWERKIAIDTGLEE